MFIWKNGSFRVVSKNLQISPKFNNFLKKYNANNKVLYICYILEEIEDEYSELLNQKQQMSLQEVYLVIKKEVSKKNSKYNGNPFLLNFLELLAESIPEEVTNKKVA
jgi:hypothetical protein